MRRAASLASRLLSPPHAPLVASPRGIRYCAIHLLPAVDKLQLLGRGHVEEGDVDAVAVPQAQVLGRVLAHEVRAVIEEGELLRRDVGAHGVRGE